MDALEEPLVSTWWRSKRLGLIASGMAGIMDDIYTDLDKVCKEKLEGITVDDIDRRIF